MIVPAVMAVPSNTLTPRRCALESRPLRVEPPPLVFDISIASRSRPAMPVVLAGVVWLAGPLRRAAGGPYRRRRARGGAVGARSLDDRVVHYDAAPLAHGARLGEAGQQPFADPFARHLHQAELGDVEDLCARLVPGQGLTEGGHD